MKPAHVTISYVVYPPRYRPGDGYLKAKNKKRAIQLAVRMGVGAAVHRSVDFRHRVKKDRGLRCIAGSSFDHLWTFWGYQTEVVVTGRHKVCIQIESKYDRQFVAMRGVR